MDLDKNLDLEKKLEAEINNPQDVEDSAEDKNKKSVPPSEEEEETEEDESKGEDEAGEEEEKPPLKGIPFREHNRLRTELREERQAREKLAKEFEEYKTKSSQPKINEETIRAKAKELLPENASEEDIKKTEFQLKKIVELTGAGNPEAETKLQKLEEKIALMEDEKIFREEWDDFETGLKKDYPNATRQQMKEARQAMDDLAHAKQYADKEFDYVYFKNKDIFDEILTPKKSKTFESRETYISSESGENELKPDNFKPKKIPIAKLMKMREKLEETASRIDNETGWNVQYDGKNL